MDGYGCNSSCNSTDLRPMVQLDGGRFASTDLNDLYLRIIGRNIRYHNQYVVKAPELLLKNEKTFNSRSC